MSTGTKKQETNFKDSLLYKSSLKEVEGKLVFFSFARLALSKWPSRTDNYITGTVL